jgi:hypothetical protein
VTPATVFSAPSTAPDEPVDDEAEVLGVLDELVDDEEVDEDDDPESRLPTEPSSPPDDGDDEAEGDDADDDPDWLPLAEGEEDDEAEGDLLALAEGEDEDFALGEDDEDFPLDEEEPVEQSPVPLVVDPDGDAESDDAFEESVDVLAVGRSLANADFAVSVPPISSAVGIAVSASALPTGSCRRSRTGLRRAACRPPPERCSSAVRRPPPWSVSVWFW